MKEDILEQLVDEYLQHEGYFTRHNIKFKPSKNHPDYDPKLDSGHSDIDVVGIDPRRSGPDRVIAVSCKSWQGGFRPKYWIKAIKENKRVHGREAWKGFRELTRKKWAEAFIDEVTEISGSSEFIYYTAVTTLKGDKSAWENHTPFQDTLKGNQVKILTVSDILDDLLPSIGNTLASSEIGRLLQLLQSSGWLETKE